ncbi:MAG: CocE/NonD family hydrolase [Candidatus Aminicenantes bacterium]|nr:CocE/NonD family hydrolase [Candidatus Aminicenantes bacterium]
MPLRKTKISYCLLPFLFIGLLVLSPACKKDEKISSSFGEYDLFEKTSYQEWVRSSRYVEMSDGIKLAMDIIRPAANGEPVEEPLPCIWTHARYHRARFHEGKIYSMVDRNGYLQVMVKHGYVLAAVDVRGSGASFGRYEGVFSERETRDAYEITEWLAAQPWCDGNIGMYGGSYLGITQLMAASLDPPHLKAIFPSVACFDLFTFIRNGGIYREGFIKMWGDLTKQLDTEVPPIPVDEDADGAMAAQAVAQHKDNWDVSEEAPKVRFRDDEAWEKQFQKTNPSFNIEKINASGVAVYLWSGFYDIWMRDAFLWFANLKTPKKLGVGSWPHGYWTDALSQERERLLRVETLRWYDYWLKGIKNGVMNGPSINFSILEKPDKWSWRHTDTWPLPEAETADYYFSGGSSGSVNSVNDGLLTLDQPNADSLYDVYTTDFSTTSGTFTRWANAAGAPMSYPDMTPMDIKGLTYTTAELTKDVTAVGSPLVHLFVTSDRPDGDFYVFLEEVDAEGTSFYISEGMLRASCREQGEAPYDNLGLPYFPISQKNTRELEEGEIVMLVFDLHPVSNVFDAGHRIRVTLVCADAGNTELYMKEEVPTIKVYRSAGNASRILLPVIQN